MGGCTGLNVVGLSFEPLTAVQLGGAKPTVAFASSATDVTPLAGPPGGTTSAAAVFQDPPQVIGLMALLPVLIESLAVELDIVEPTTTTLQVEHPLKSMALLRVGFRTEMA
jgi:hypothetical protein